ncbi:hypothetical protein B0H14DRAFT_3514874 [Mycena olivaceomarginata]|nr:hypothetical protein B0H14DRAFT_3514874 [Mycena olivaceomarginata]
MVNVPVQEIRRRFEVIRKVVEYFGLEYVKEHVGQLTRLHAVMGTANTFHQFGKLKINFTQLRSYLDGYDTYFMKPGTNTPSVIRQRSRSCKTQSRHGTILLCPPLPLVVWVLVQTGPWRHFPGFRWYALPLRPPPLPLTRLLLLVRRLLLARLLLFARPASDRAPALALAPPPRSCCCTCWCRCTRTSHTTPTPHRRLAPFPNLPTPAATPARAPALLAPPLLIAPPLLLAPPSCSRAPLIPAPWTSCRS